MVEKLVDAGVIRESRSAYYSHGFVVPKSTPGEWRFVIDYKKLNKVCTTERWPLPNIESILRRIGDERPQYFSVMDMMSGYHQAPVAEDTIPYTAFMTSAGLFEWTRVLMGPTGACSYFQKTMSREVFIGLVNHICEVYLDDLIVYSSNEDQMIDRLRRVFERAREKRITFNPKKCRFGLSSVEYIGHTIDSEGIHFSRKKLDSILDFEIPATQARMRSFIGFVNYFRDHVKDFAKLANPLIQTYKVYKPKRLIKYTDELQKAFHVLVQAINTCPKVYFLDDTLPIHLHTDASDYGIGAFLFQIIVKMENGKRKETVQPVAFLSKSLNGRESRWDVPQKEGFAIFSALNK